MASSHGCTHQKCSRALSYQTAALASLGRSVSGRMHTTMPVQTDSASATWLLFKAQRREWSLPCLWSLRHTGSVYPKALAGFSLHCILCWAAPFQLPSCPLQFSKEAMFNVKMIFQQFLMFRLKLFEIEGWPVNDSVTMWKQIERNLFAFSPFLNGKIPIKRKG